MQEEIAKTSEVKKRRQIKLELRQSHVAKWKQSGMSMSEYCRANDLALSSFSAWAQAYQLIKQAFKPVIVRSPSVEPIKPVSNVVEILISDKLKIRLIDVSNVSLVIDIAKELMRCS